MEWAETSVDWIQHLVGAVAVSLAIWWARRTIRNL